MAVYLAYPCKAPAACLGLPLRSPKGGEGQAYGLASPKIQLILLHQRNQHLSKSIILGEETTPWIQRQILRVVSKLQLLGLPCFVCNRSQPSKRTLPVKQNGAAAVALVIWQA